MTTTQASKTVTLEPYTRNGQTLVADVAHQNKLLTSDTYHSIRDGIMGMRKDPASGALYDKYLTEVVQNNKDWPPAEMNKLKTMLAKSGVGFSGLVNEVGMDLKSHGYSASYRPALAISVNGRPMHPEVVVRELKASGVELKGDIPRSVAPDKISGALHIEAGDAQKMANNFASEQLQRGFKMTSGQLMEEVTHHARKFGIYGKAVGAAVAGGLAMAQGANAAEVGMASVNAVAPGAGTLGKLAIGEGPKKGVLCESFGEAAGAASGVVAGVAVFLGTGYTGPVGAALAVGAAAGTELVMTPIARKACDLVM
ncbi:MAG: hypothetical protein A3J37_07590 [Alphaproteobacteria bacterium RIFCSPHIGHO2_12_FULL_45_9]|nr:MAG: hypothetical protein A3B66_06335 [Alphaproteobacteria bacterium RIFCSPHIGHO2_02_FULL_46_13]OFW99655.1 MAG: hypothetical protein A3J37_07590 [Alphaproteobacteria bacterium RIFCSPHIGHO2_12_FULL_45_9]